MNQQRGGFSNTVYYFAGVGIGLIPLALLLFSLRSSGPLLTVGLFYYAVQFIVTIVCLAMRRMRFVGYGLLTMVILIPPIAVQISCTVSSQGHI